MSIERGTGIAENLRSFDASTASDGAVAALAATIYHAALTEASTLLRSPITAPLGQLVQARATLAELLSTCLAARIGHPGGEAALLRELFSARLSNCDATRSMVADVAKAFTSDPAVCSILQPILLFKGFLALTAHRVAHSLWLEGSDTSAFTALLLQSRVSEAFGVDIHPGATIGHGVMLDHASAVVIGETAVVGDDVRHLDPRARSAHHHQAAKRLSMPRLLQQTRPCARHLVAPSPPRVRRSTCFTG